MVLSQLPLAICFPSGLHANERTMKFREAITRINRTREKKIEKTYQLECPVSVESQWPVEMSQILTVLSKLPLATSLPSGEKATELTL